MARYIDADKIEYFAKYVGMDEFAGWQTIAYKHDIDTMPTADVVPKSEVEATVEKLMSATDKVICEAKAEVAREIFEEISKASAFWSCYCISSTKWGYVTHDVSRTLAELKKKYLEETT